MQISASVRTKFLKPKKGWKSIDLRDAVGRLTLEATRPDDTQLLRWLHRAMGGFEKAAKITVQIEGKDVCEYTNPGTKGDRS